MSHLIKILALFLLILIYSNCKTIQLNSYEWKIVDLPIQTQISGEPNLYATGDHVYLSWVEQLIDSTHALMFSQLNNRQWTPPKTIVQGKHWFVNWADFPSLVVQPDDKAMAAHWLQKSAAGTFDYDIRVTQSNDGGNTWQSPFTLHSDGVAAEHGFVSMVPLNDNQIFATWLDGRHTKHEKEHDHGSGSMTLRSAIFDQKGRLAQEIELDEKVCDCCQTAAINTSKGMVVAYRNRSEEEIRDIYVMREVDGEWLKSQAVFPDNWKINGCPVNGPALAAKNNTVALAWYTAANGEPQVKLAFSNDAGAHFNQPIRIDAGNPVGRVDVLLLNHTKALVSWIEEKNNRVEIRFVIVDDVGTKITERVIISTETSRKSGFPRIVQIDNSIVLAWTEVIDKKTIIRSKQVFLTK